MPDFIGTRYGGNAPRLCAVIILVVASFTYVTAQINGTGTVAARALQIPFEVGVWIGLAGILFCSMLGGMRAVTWTQVAQYIVLIIAYLIPVFWMSNKLGYGLIPHLAQFDAVSRVQELEGLLGVKELLPTAEAQAEAGKLAALKVGINDASATAMATPAKDFATSLLALAYAPAIPDITATARSRIFGFSLALISSVTTDKGIKYVYIHERW